MSIQLYPMRVMFQEYNTPFTPVGANQLLQLRYKYKYKHIITFARQNTRQSSKVLTDTANRAHPSHAETLNQTAAPENDRLYMPGPASTIRLTPLLVHKSHNGRKYPHKHGFVKSCYPRIMLLESARIYLRTISSLAVLMQLWKDGLLSSGW